MKAYVVVEGMADLAVVRAALPKELLDEVMLEAAGERSNITSVARTLIITRRKPVAMLVETDSVAERIIRERLQTAEELLGMVSAGTPTKVILVIPSIEVVFFEAGDLLAKVLGRPLPEEVRLLGRASPKEALGRLFAQTAGPNTLNALLNGLDDEDKAALRSAPPLRTLISFLEDVVRPKKEHSVA